MCYFGEANLENATESRLTYTRAPPGEGIADTYTPFHKDSCASVGQNLMVLAINNASSFWCASSSFYFFLPVASLTRGKLGSSHQLMRGGRSPSIFRVNSSLSLIGRTSCSVLRTLYPFHVQFTSASSFRATSF